MIADTILAEIDKLSLNNGTKEHALLSQFTAIGLRLDNITTPMKEQLRDTVHWILPREGRKAESFKDKEDSSSVVTQCLSTWNCGLH